jgi:hypothetical protein
MLPWPESRPLSSCSGPDHAGSESPGGSTDWRGQGPRGWSPSQNERWGVIVVVHQDSLSCMEFYATRSILAHEDHSKAVSLIHFTAVNSNFGPVAIRHISRLFRDDNAEDLCLVLPRRGCLVMADVGQGLRDEGRWRMSAGGFPPTLPPPPDRSPPKPLRTSSTVIVIWQASD